MTEHYPTARLPWLAAALGRTEMAVRARAAAFGLRREGHRGGEPADGPGRPWTRTEEAFLAQHRRESSLAELALALDRSVPEIVGRAVRYGLALFPLGEDASPSHRGKGGARHAGRKPGRRPETRPWLAAEDALLRKHYGQPGWPELLRQTLDRTRRAIGLRAVQLGLSQGSPRLWRVEEDACLREHYAQGNWPELIEALDRTQPAIEMRAHKLGLRPRRRSWSPAEDALLAARYSQADWPELIDALGRPKSAIYRRAHQLGLRRRVGKLIGWSQVELVWLAENFAKLTWPELRQALGRSKNTIVRQARALGLSHAAESGPDEPDH